jgi:hypothetical protein
MWHLAMDGGLCGNYFSSFSEISDDVKNHWKIKRLQLYLLHQIFMYSSLQVCVHANTSYINASKYELK